MAILRTLGNVATGSDEQLNYLISINAIPYLEKSLSRNQKTVRREACWVLSNITAGSTFAITAVLGRMELVRELVNILDNDLPNIKEEALYALVNATENGEKAALAGLYREVELVRHISDMVKECKDVSAQETALECLGYVLELGSKLTESKSRNMFVAELFNLKMVEVLEELQYSESDKIYDRVSYILCNFFDLETPLQT